MEAAAHDLRGMRVMALHSTALAEGVGAEAVEAAMDEDDPRAARVSPSLAAVAPKGMARWESNTEAGRARQRGYGARTRSPEPSQRVGVATASCAPESAPAFVPQNVTV